MNTEPLRIRVTAAAGAFLDVTFCASVTERLPVRARRKLRRGTVSGGAPVATQDGVPGEGFCSVEGPRVSPAWLE